MEEIHDIKGLFSLYGWFYPLLFTLLGALLCLVAFLAYRSYRRRQPKETNAMPPAKPLPADVIALERLEALRRAAHEMEPKPFHFELSETLRVYLEARFAIPATDRTTEEIHRLLPEGSDLSLEAQKEVLGVLRHADQVKFSDYRPQTEEALRELERARLCILKTRVETAPGETPS